MNNNIIIGRTEQQNQENLKDEIKIGNTIFVVNQIFSPNQTKQDAWLSIITRAESLKSDK